MKRQDNEGIRFLNLPEMKYIQAVYGTNITNTFPTHIHKSFCIGVVDKGARVIYHRGVSTLIPEGKLFIINPGEPHTCKSYDKKRQNYRIICIEMNFMQSIAFQIFQKAQYTPYFKNILISDKQVMDKIHRFFLFIDQPDFILEKESLLLSLLAELILRYGESLPAPCKIYPQHNAINRVMEYIETNYANTLSLQELSQAAYLSPFHFHRLFLKATGISPHNYLVQFRIKKAMEFLLKGVSLVDVALDTGFTDQSHFTRCFKRIVGIPPGKYLRLHKK